MGSWTDCALENENKPHLPNSKQEFSTRKLDPTRDSVWNSKFLPVQRMAPTGKLICRTDSWTKITYNSENKSGLSYSWNKFCTLKVDPTHDSARNWKFLGGELASPPYVMDSDATPFCRPSNESKVAEYEVCGIKMTGRSAWTFITIARIVRPIISYTKPRKPANLGHFRVVTPTYWTVAPTNVVIVVRMRYKNDGAVSAHILAYSNGQCVDENGHN